MKRAIVLLNIVLAAPLPALAQGADPLSGRWELNLAKSTYDPGPPPQSAVRIQHVDGDVLNVALEIVLPDGRSGDAHFTARLDGRDRPLPDAASADETIAWRRTDARTLEYTRKKAGKVTESGRLQVSADGSELTVSTRGADAKGRPFETVAVYDRWRS